MSQSASLLPSVRPSSPGDCELQPALDSSRVRLLVSEAAGASSLKTHSRPAPTVLSDIKCRSLPAPFSVGPPGGGGRFHRERDATYSSLPSSPGSLSPPLHSAYLFIFFSPFSDPLTLLAAINQLSPFTLLIPFKNLCNAVGTVARLRLEGFSFLMR